MLMLNLLLQNVCNLTKYSVFIILSIMQIMQINYHKQTREMSIYLYDYISHIKTILIDNDFVTYTLYYLKGKVIKNR